MRSVWLASSARCSLSLITVRMNSWRDSRGSSGSSSTSSAKPRIAIRGFRKSWATIPPNSLFRLLDLVVEAQVLDRDRHLPGEGEQQVQVLVGEVSVVRTVAHGEEPEDLGAAGDWRREERAHSQGRHEVGEQPRVGLRLVREKRPIA